MLLQKKQRAKPRRRSSNAVAGETEKGAEHQRTLEVVAAPAPEAEVSPVWDEETVPATFVFDDASWKRTECEESGVVRASCNKIAASAVSWFLTRAPARWSHAASTGGGQGKDWEDSR